MSRAVRRYAAMFARLAERGEGAFGAFVMLGDPDLATSARLLDSLVEGGAYSERVRAASHSAITREIEEVDEVLSNYSSESELDDHASVLRKLAPRAGVPEYSLERALEAVDERIAEVQVTQAKAADPELPNTAAVTDDDFEDDALYNLFESLR